MKKLIFMAAFLLAAIFTAEAQHQVSGKVAAPNGDPIVGAIVKEEGSSRGTVTDPDGHYTLATKRNATLSYSYINYETVRQAVEGKSELNITLQPSGDDGKTLYLVDGKPVPKAILDGIPAEAIQNMNVMRGVESVVLVTTKKEADITIVRYPKQTQSTVIKIDKQTDEVTIDEKLNGTTLRFHKKQTPAQEGDPLILIKKADGSLQAAESVGDVKPEDIQTISVYKDAEHLKQFEPYGETKGGVIYIELKK